MGKGVLIININRIAIVYAYFVDLSVAFALSALLKQTFREQ